MSLPLRIVIAVLWTVALLAGLAIPSSGLPDIQIKNLDKIAHLLLFFVFGILWMGALRLELRTRMAVVIGIGILVAIGTELMQGMLPFERQPDHLDVVADVIGLVIGVGTYRALARRRQAVRS